MTERQGERLNGKKNWYKAKRATGQRSDKKNDWSIDWKIATRMTETKKRLEQRGKNDWSCNDKEQLERSDWKK